MHSSRAKVKLLFGSAGQSAARVDKLKAWDTESVYVNQTKYPKYSADLYDSSGLGVWKTTLFVTRPKAVGPGVPITGTNGVRNVQRSESLASAEFIGEGNGLDGGLEERDVSDLYALNRERLVKSVNEVPCPTFDSLNVSVTRFKPGAMNGAHGSSSNPGGSGGDFEGVDTSVDGHAGSASGSGSEPKDEQGADPLTLGKPYTSKRKAAKRRNAQRRKAWTSVADKFTDGVQDGWLFRTVIQSIPSVEEFEGGYDSDAENVIDEDWRLELGDKQISEFVDTSTQEKMYMCLWNQFVLREVYVYSDRRQLDVCCMFSHRYGGLLYALNLNVIFVRHLHELHDRGIIDAGGIHQAIVELGRARVEAIADSQLVDEQLSQFAFYTRIMGEDAKATAEAG